MGERWNVKNVLRQGRKIKALSCNHCYRGTAVSMIYSESVCVALDMQYAKRMRRVISSFVAFPALLGFSTLSDK